MIRRRDVDAVALLFALHTATTADELHRARLDAIRSGFPLGADPLRGWCHAFGSGAAVGCPRNRAVPGTHVDDHAPITFAARLGALSRRYAHHTGEETP